VRLDEDHLAVRDRASLQINFITKLGNDVNTSHGETGTQINIGIQQQQSAYFYDSYARQ